MVELGSGRDCDSERRFLGGLDAGSYSFWKSQSSKLDIFIFVFAFVVQPGSPIGKRDIIKLNVVVEKCET